MGRRADGLWRRRAGGRWQGGGAAAAARHMRGGRWPNQLEGVRGSMDPYGHARAQRTAGLPGIWLPLSCPLSAHLACPAEAVNLLLLLLLLLLQRRARQVRQAARGLCGDQERGRDWVGLPGARAGAEPARLIRRGWHGRQGVCEPACLPAGCWALLACQAVNQSSSLSICSAAGDRRLAAGRLVPGL